MIIKIVVDSCAATNLTEKHHKAEKYFMVTILFLLLRIFRIGTSVIFFCVFEALSISQKQSGNGDRDENTVRNVLTSKLHAIIDRTQRSTPTLKCVFHTVVSFTIHISTFKVSKISFFL